jgi:hypothetical protein
MAGRSTMSDEEDVFKNASEGIRQKITSITVAKKKLGYETEAIDHASISETKTFLMNKLFAKGEHSRLIAPPKMMKSAWGASAANHLAAGKDWRGFKVKRAVGVLYCALERPNLTKRRLIAEQKLMKWENLPIHLCRKRFSLASEADAKRLIETIKETGGIIGRPVEFLEIDTSAKLISAHGGDEQQARDNALVWGYLSDVREKTGVHTLVIGHTGKVVSKGERGSNASLGDADIVISITGDGDIKTATITDANDAAEGELFSFKGKKYSFGTDEDGEEDFVYILDPETAPAGEREKKLTANQKTFFRILHDADSSGLTREDWYEQAKKAGLGAGRRATLTDLFNEMKDLKLVREYAGRWKVKHD